jgi:hypothetical protein
MHKIRIEITDQSMKDIADAVLHINPPPSAEAPAHKEPVKETIPVCVVCHKAIFDPVVQRAGNASR